MDACDMIVCTGSQNNVHRAQTAGTPAVAVGAGNVTVIVDETADLAEAAKKMRASKCFDNATSCSSENSAVVVDAVYDAFVAAMAQEGGALVDDENGIVAKLWPNGHLNRSVIAQDADKMIAALDLDVPEGTDYIAVPTRGIGPDHPLSGEKLSRVLALYRASDFDEAVTMTRRIQVYQGAGHSVGLHSNDDNRARALATAIPTSRVIVNQAHTFATGGAFTNGMPFSLSMGCGTWGGNSVGENVNYRHFMQSTKIIREIPTREPSLDAIFAEYWDAAGR
jgi:sulfoacetaldehyde dehydrogenase